MSKKKDFSSFFEEINEIKDDLNGGSFNSLGDTHNSIDLQVLDTWGGEAQLFMLIEEMAELTQAISKRERGLTHNIAEEIADVEITLSQVKQYLDLGEDIYKWKNYKYERIRRRLKEHKNNE